jgi:hypothetical protein
MGDIVLVTATLDSTAASTGVAQKAVLEHAVVGPVNSVDSAGGVIVALGQTVKLANAAFDLSIPQSSIAGLAIATSSKFPAFATSAARSSHRESQSECRGVPGSGPRAGSRISTSPRHVSRSTR